MSGQWLSVRGHPRWARAEETPSPSKAGPHAARLEAGISFVHISDGSAFHPCRPWSRTRLSNFADVQKLTAAAPSRRQARSFLRRPKGQPFEMQASEVRVVGWVEDPDHYPIQPKPHTMEFLREVAHLRPRTNVIGAATRVRHTVAKAIHRFFDENGFVWVATPIITSADAEGARARCSASPRSTRSISSAAKRS
jgi:asparaginyl-tRNA synthetase